MLQDGEMVEAERGYRGEFYKVQTAVDYNDNNEKIMKRKRLARHKTVNRRFKQFGVLKQVFCHHIGVHRVVFASIVVINQLSVNNGKKLFQVDYH